MTTDKKLELKFRHFIRKWTLSHTCSHHGPITGLMFVSLFMLWKPV